MEFQYLFRFVQQHTILVLAISVLAAVITFFVTYILPYYYDASSLVLVRPRAETQLSPMGSSNAEVLNYPVNSSFNVDSPSKTFVEIIQSESFVGSIVEKLDLDKDEPEEAADPFKEFLLGLKDSLIDGLKAFRDILKHGMVIEETPYDEAVRNTSENLSVQTLAETSIFEISFTDEDPEKAALVVNTTVDLFLEFVSSMSRGDLSQEKRILEEQLQESRKDLQGAREKLRVFKDEHSIFELTSEYNEALSVVTELEHKLEEISTELAGLETNPMQHLKIQEVAAQRDVLEQTISERKQYLRDIAELESKLRSLELDLSITQEAYEILSTAYQEAVVAETQVAPEVAVISPATTPNKPSQPNKLKYSLITFALTLIFSMGGLLIRDILYPRIRNAGDVQRVLNLPVLATVTEASSTR